LSSALGNILLLWDRAGDYHVARFRALQSAFEGGKVYLADLGAADGLYQWKSEVDPGQYCRLSEKPVEKSDLRRRLLRFQKLLKRADIQYIGIPGYGRLEYILMLIYATIAGKRMVMFAESWYGNSPVLNGLKGLFLSLTCNGLLVSGQRAKNHFSQKLGLSNMPVEIGYSVVENAHFESVAEIDREPVLLCVARFAPEKNLMLLVEAFLESKLSKTWKLVLVGGGPLAQELEGMVANRTEIVLHNWLSYEALPFLYAQARFFVLPSLFEPWGLVVNEAMAAGLPVLVSEECGCRPDLVDTSNGLVFNANDKDGLVIELNRIESMSPARLTAMGEASRTKIAAFTPQLWARRFLKLAMG